MSGDTCSRRGCESPATRRGQLRLWALGHPKSAHSPIVATMGLTVCTACADLLGLEDVITDEGKRKIDAGIVGAGRARPSWKTAEFEWVPIA